MKIVIAVLLAACAAFSLDTLATPNTFTAHDTVRAAKVNANFDTIRTRVNRIRDTLAGVLAGTKTGTFAGTLTGNVTGNVSGNVTSTGASVFDSTYHRKIGIGSYFGIGTANPLYEIDLVKAAADANCLFTDYSTNAANSAYFFFNKSASNTANTLAATVHGDVLGQMAFRGVKSDNGGFVTGAKLYVQQAGAAGSSYIGGRIIVATGSNTVGFTTRMVIDTGGYIGIGVSTTPVAALDINRNGGFKMSTGSAIIDSARVVVDTLEFWVGGNRYKALK